MTTFTWNSGKTKTMGGESDPWFPEAEDKGRFDCKGKWGKLGGVMELFCILIVAVVT